jgi:hypothetical protein
MKCMFTLDFSRRCPSHRVPFKLRNRFRVFATAGSRVQLKRDGTQWRTGGEVKGLEWVASTLHTASEHGVSSITTAHAHISAASSQLNWRPRQFKWTRPFRRKTKSGFCGCAITFQTLSTTGTDFLELCVGQLMIFPEFQGHSVDDILVAVGLFIKIRKITRGHIRQVRRVGGPRPCF